jgi:hypothetical protein
MEWEASTGATAGDCWFRHGQQSDLRRGLAARTDPQVLVFCQALRLGWPSLGMARVGRSHRPWCWSLVAFRSSRLPEVACLYRLRDRAGRDPRRRVLAHWGAFPLWMGRR